MGGAGEDIFFRGLLLNRIKNREIFYRILRCRTFLDLNRSHRAILINDDVNLFFIAVTVKIQGRLLAGGSPADDKSGFPRYPEPGEVHISPPLTPANPLPE